MRFLTLHSGKRSDNGLGRPRSRRARNTRLAAVTCFQLESRTLLSLVWSNQGQPSDGIDAVYGAGSANANLARGDIAAALGLWNQCITNFNQPGGGNTINVQVTMDVSRTGLLGSNPPQFPFGANTAVTAYTNGYPTAATIRIDSGYDTDNDGSGDGLGWFLDPTPYDNSEFLGGMVTPFISAAAPGGPASGLCDLLSVTDHELVHALGISADASSRFQQDPNHYLADTGTPEGQTNGPGELWTFVGPTVGALLTSNNGGINGTDFSVPIHMAEPRTSDLPVNGQFGTVDLFNPSYPDSRRGLPSLVDTFVLGDAYGYSVISQPAFTTFQSVLNQTTGLLTVQGGVGNSNDTIDVGRSGNNIDVTVTIGTPVPGTTTGNTFHYTYTTDQVQSISVSGFAGDDTITLAEDLRVPASVYGGSGNDLIYGSFGNDYLDGGDGNDTIFGRGGNDSLIGDAGNDRLYGSLGNEYLAGGDGDDTLWGGGGNDSLVGGSGNDQLFCGDGSDTIYWGADTTDANGNLVGDGFDTVEGGSGQNVLMFFGSASTGNNVSLEAVAKRGLVTLSNPAPGVTGSVSMANVGYVQVFGSSLADSYIVGDLSGTDITLVDLDTYFGLSGPDSVKDTVIVNGTNAADSVTISPGPGTRSDVSGLAAQVRVLNTTTLDELDVLGLGGDDRLVAQAGVEANVSLKLDGGDGNDFLSADATLLGGAGNDTLIGGAGNDSLDGGAGDDVLFGGAGNNTLVGGDGNDSIQVTGTAFADNVTLSQTGNTVSISVNGVTGTNLIPNNDIERVWVVGQDSDDYVNASLTPATAVALPMLIDGGGGNDTLIGGAGSDTIIGGAGNDQLVGGAGGIDNLDGGDGSDTFVWNPGGGVSIIEGGGGRNILQFNGSAVQNNSILLSADPFALNRAGATLAGDPGAVSMVDVSYVQLIGGTGQDLFHVTDLGQTDVKLVSLDFGADSLEDAAIIEGTNLPDTILVAQSPGIPAIELDGLAAQVLAIHSTATDWLDVSGGLGNDQITVDSLVLPQLSVQLEGGSGNDLLTGASRILGGSGDDTIVGTAGSDTLLGGPGNDVITGLDGNDWIQGDGDATGLGNSGVLMPAFAIAAIDPAGGGNDTIDAGAGNDTVLGGVGNDAIQGGPGNDVLQGNDGNDTISGGAGDDQIWGGAGNDTLHGGDGNDTLVGGDGNDVMYGDAGNDLMFGQAGNDVLYGGQGNDMMFGGDGNDYLHGGDGIVNKIHQVRAVYPSDGDDVLAGGAGKDSLDGGNGNNLLDAGDEGISELVRSGAGNDIAFGHYNHDGKRDTFALDGGCNKVYLHGGIAEPIVPAESTALSAFSVVIPTPSGQYIRQPGNPAKVYSTAAAPLPARSAALPKAVSPAKVKIVAQPARTTVRSANLFAARGSMVKRIPLAAVRLAALAVAKKQS